MTRPRGAMASALRRIPDFQRLEQRGPGRSCPALHPSRLCAARQQRALRQAAHPDPDRPLRRGARSDARRRALSGARRGADERRAPALADRQGGRRASLRNRAAPLSLTEPSEILQGQLENALPPLGDRPRPPDPAHGPAGHGRRREPARAEPRRPLHRRDSRAEPAADDARRAGRRAARSRSPPTRR